MNMTHHSGLVLLFLGLTATAKAKVGSQGSVTGGEESFAKPDQRITIP